MKAHRVKNIKLNFVAIGNKETAISDQRASLLMAKRNYNRIVPLTINTSPNNANYFMRMGRYIDL